jgi:uncharacterized protein YndB with AHSA1/START domain
MGAATGTGTASEHPPLEVCTALAANGAVTLDYSIQLAASPERVFAALTTEVERWWPHTMRERPHGIVLEPQLGGRFMELWDANGSGALYGHVEIYEPPRLLRIRGSVGMALAVNVMWTVSLAESAGGTLLREVAHISGEVSDRLAEGMRGGTETEYQALRAWLEQGTALR